MNQDIPLDTEDAEEEQEPGVNLCRYIPKIGVELLNMYTMLCPKCSEKRIMNSNHLRTVHNLGILDPLALFRYTITTIEGTSQDECKDRPSETRVKKMTRAYEIVSKEYDIVKKFIE